MKKAAVFLADGFEEVEALTPVDYLRRAGVEVITIAIPSSTMTFKKRERTQNSLRQETTPRCPQARCNRSSNVTKSIQREILS